MNRGRKLKQLRKFILKYGNITKEYKCQPIRWYAPYRNGSYFAAYDSDELDFSCCCGDVDKYKVYKYLFYMIKQEIARREQLNG